MNIMETASAAVGQQTKRMEASAARVASMGKETEKGEDVVDLAKEAAIRIEASAATSANLAVIKSEDERLQHMLDLFA
jgi:flagellar basal body rod protein FlgC